jgi:phosphatidylserine decarboxylase
MRVAPEGWPFIAIAWIVLGLLAWMHLWIPAILWLPIAVWVVAFFRDPLRDGPRGDEIVLAPADGKVVSVISIDEPLFIRGPATRIAIFMNVFNVHVNRYPTRGRIGFRDYVRGQFGHAGREKASTENEHSSVGLDTPKGRLLIRQIAGSIARRIVTDHGEGTDVGQAERMGLIRFGSRVDVFVPTGATVLVKEGDTTLAAQTVVAQWK